MLVAIRPEVRTPRSGWRSLATLFAGVLLGGCAVMSIDARFAAPDLPVLRSTLSQLIASVRITLPVNASPEPTP